MTTVLVVCVPPSRADRGKSAFSARSNWMFLESANQLFAVSHHWYTNTLICSTLIAESSRKSIWQYQSQLH